MLKVKIMSDEKEEEELLDVMGFSHSGFVSNRTLFVPQRPSHQIGKQQHPFLSYEVLMGAEQDWSRMATLMNQSRLL